MDGVIRGVYDVFWDGYRIRMGSIIDGILVISTFGSVILGFLDGWMGFGWICRWTGEYNGGLLWLSEMNE